MTPAVQRAADFAADRLRRLRDAAKRHPVRVALVLPALMLLYLLLLIPFTPGIGDLRKAKSEVPARVMSADGVLLAEFKRVNRQWVPLNKISPHVVDALIATEDHRFYQHHGIDFRRTGGGGAEHLEGRAAGRLDHHAAAGAQPLSRARSAARPRSHRKAKEAITALKIEALYTKNEILETYLNTVPFLYNAFGIEMAARTYFDKTADRLDVLESATLIGMLKGTSYYNPVLEPRARARPPQSRAGADGPIRQARSGQAGGLAEAAAARRLRAPGRAARAGAARGAARAPMADRAGPTARATTSTPTAWWCAPPSSSRLQKAANQAVARQTAQLQSLADAQRRRGQERRAAAGRLPGAGPAQRPGQGLGRQPRLRQEQFDHVSQARRQPGSTFKPFVYGAAFVQGFSPVVHLHRPSRWRSHGRGNEVWTPSDATPPSGQPMSLRDGLVYSKNTITAQLMQKVGPAKVGATGAGHGRAAEQAGPGALAGPGHQPGHARRRWWRPTAPSPMAAATSNRCWWCAWKTAHGKTLEGFEPHARDRPCRGRIALTLVNVMRGVVDEGTGVAIRQRYGIQADVAGKTGTTQDNSDGWFILMHPQLVAGAWVGFNDNRVSDGAVGAGRAQRAAHRRRSLPAVVAPPLDRPAGRVRHPAAAAGAAAPAAGTTRC